MDNNSIKIKDYNEFFKVPDVRWEAGLFDYEIIIQFTNDEIMSVLNDWLCDNCLDNFVVLRISTELVAGGNTQPGQTWERRKKAGPPNISDPKQCYDVSMNIHIRLCITDVLGFRLTWIL